MVKIKKIPCRVCKKPFKPCGYCQSHSDVFRWRNFACSIKCAQKYIADTISYRDTQNGNNVSVEFPVKEENIEKEKTKKSYKKRSTEEEVNLDNILINQSKETD